MKSRPDDVRLALEWALAAVKAMPAEQVPHNLRRIRVSSARRLTRLHERTIHRELDRNRSLRETTLEVLESAAPEEVSEAADPRVRISRLFLTRPEGWEEDAGRLLTEVRLEDSREEAASLQKELDGARGEVGKLKKQVKEARRSAVSQSRRATRRLRETLDRTKRRNRDLEGEISRQHQANHDLNRELEASFDELTLVDARVEELRKLVGKERSASSTLSPGAVGHRRGEGLTRDPLEAARMLDQMVRFWEVGPDARIERVVKPVRLEIPAGIDPKSAEAVQWVYDDAPRVNLIVDGWNAAFHHIYRLHGGNTDQRPDQKTVEYVTNKLDKLARYSIGEHRVRFYLDSEHANGLSPEWASRFKSGHLTGFYVKDADDAIVVEAKERVGEPVVVITSDNGLAERCEEHGAVRVYSEALAEWMANSPV